MYRRTIGMSHFSDEYTTINGLEKSVPQSCQKGIQTNPKLFYTNLANVSTCPPITDYPNNHNHIPTCNNASFVECRQAISTNKLIRTKLSKGNTKEEENGSNDTHDIGISEKHKIQLISGCSDYSKVITNLQSSNDVDTPQNDIPVPESPVSVESQQEEKAELCTAESCS